MKNCIYNLNSGLRLVHKKIEGVHSVAVGIFTNVGSSDETESNNGISHFIEHMLFKGTQERSSFDIVCEIDGLGAQVNAFTAKQMTCYYTISVGEYAENCVKVLSDLFFNSTFATEELDRERGVVIEEIAMSEDTPDDLCLEKLSQVFYQGNSLGRSILGSADNIRKFTSQDLKDYKADKYCADNTIICIVGNIEQSQAYDLASKYFEGKFAKQTSIRNEDIRHDINSNSIITIKDLEQANLAIAFPSLEFGNDKSMALNLVNTIFGGGMSSRLFQEIREKRGLAYNVFSYPSAYCNNGDYAIYLGTNPNTCEQAIKAVKESIIDLKGNGLTQAELERGKKQLKGAYVLGQESTSSQMRIFARFALFKNTCFDFDEKLREIDAITMDEVKSVIDYIFDFDKVCVSYVGKKIKYNPLDIIKG